MSLRGVTKLYSRIGERADTIKESILSSLTRSSRRGLITALSDISLEINRGEALGLIGPNGSGKSTLLKIIAGITSPTAGTVVTRGRVISMIELGTGFHPDLSGEENIRLQGSIFGLSSARVEPLVDPILAFAELDDFRHMPVKHYSSGMFLRLGFAIAIHTEPDVLLVDEVLAVGDLHFQERCIGRIRQMIGSGMTLVLVTHYPELVERVCEKAAWLEAGGIRRFGSALEVLMDYNHDLITRRYASSQGALGKRDFTAGVPGRFGTGEAWMTGVRIRDASGRPRLNFRRGQALTLEIEYAAGPGVCAVDCIVTLEDATYGALVALWCAFCDGCTSIPQAGKGIFRLDVAELALLPGRYGLTIAIHPPDDDDTQYDVLYKLFHFTVAAEPDWETVAPVELKSIVKR